MIVQGFKESPKQFVVGLNRSNEKALSQLDVSRFFPFVLLIGPGTLNADLVIQYY